MAALFSRIKFKRSKRNLTASLVVVCLAVGIIGVPFIGSSVSTAGASSVHLEGTDGNNIVCGGVHSVAQAIKYYNGAPDLCGHTDIGKIWTAMGITLPIIKAMFFGTVCSNQGFISSGRLMGPDPSQNVHRYYGGASLWTRPLAVWGVTCYSALKGYTEDGHTVAILTGCGNGETTQFPPAFPKPKPKPPVIHHPKPKPKPRPVVCYIGTTPEYSVPAGYSVISGNCVSAEQTCVTDNGGAWNGVTGICTVTVSSCSDVTQVYGNNNVVYVTNYGNCDVSPPPVVVVTPPPVIVVTPPPPTTTTTLPPAKPQPPTVTILTQPQEVSISGTTVVGATPFKSDVSGPSGDSLTVVLSAQWGSFPNSTFPFGGGMNQVNTTYDAPSELPPVSTINGVTTNWDTVTVTVYDTTTGLSASASVSFQILPPSTSRG